MSFKFGWNKIDMRGILVLHYIELYYLMQLWFIFEFVSQFKCIDLFQFWPGNKQDDEYIYYPKLNPTRSYPFQIQERHYSWYQFDCLWDSLGMKRAIILFNHVFLVQFNAAYDVCCILDSANVANKGFDCLGNCRIVPIRMRNWLILMT